MAMAMATEHGEIFDCVPCGFHAEIARRDPSASLAIFPCPRCGRRKRAGLSFILITLAWCAPILGAAAVVVLHLEVNGIAALMLAVLACVVSLGIVARQRRRWVDARRTIVFYSH